MWNSRTTLRKNIEELGRDEPWVAHIRTGKEGLYCKPKPEKSKGRVPTTLAAKQSLIMHLLTQSLGTIRNKKFLDVGSNQGYTSLELLLRKGNVVAIEP